MLIFTSLPQSQIHCTHVIKLIIRRYSNGSNSSSNSSSCLWAASVKPRPPRRPQPLQTLPITFWSSDDYRRLRGSGSMWRIVFSSSQRE